MGIITTSVLPCILFASMVRGDQSVYTGGFRSGGFGGARGGGFGGSNGGFGGQGSGDPIQDLEGSVPGIPGEDYPIFAEVPETSFLCDGQVDGGYYADPEAECQAFHICASDGFENLAKYSFLCPNGTLFNQLYFVCDWWFNTDCSQAESLYFLNEEVAAEREAASQGAGGAGQASYNNRQTGRSGNGGSSSGGRYNGRQGSGSGAGRNSAGGQRSAGNSYSAPVGSASAVNENYASPSSSFRGSQGSSGNALGGSYSAPGGSANAPGGSYSAPGRSGGSSGRSAAGGSYSAPGGSASAPGGSYSAPGRNANAPDAVYVSARRGGRSRRFRG